MLLGKIDGQTAGINIQAINRSAAQKTGKSPEEIWARTGQNDTLTLSPTGKKQSLIDQLMKQKDFLQERKQSLMDAASENGSPSLEQLKEYDEQLKNLDEQIAQLQTEQMSETEETEEDKEGKIYEKPKTKEEAQTEEIAQLTSMASTLDQAEVISSVKDKIDGNVRVLEAEIRSGNGNIEKKVEKAADFRSQSEQLNTDMAAKIEEVNSSVEAAPAKSKDIPKEPEESKNLSSQSEFYEDETTEE